MSDVVVAWKKGILGRNHVYPEIDSNEFLGLVHLFDTDKNEQIFVHREGEKVYYVYLWRLTKFDYISLGLLTNKLCLDYYDLLRTFRTFVKDMAANKLCVYNNKSGKIKLSSHNIQKQPRQRILLDINIKNLKAQLDEKQKKWINLPSQKLGILKSDVVPCTLEIQGSSWIVTQITSGYRNVCISIRDEIKPLSKDGRSKDSSIASIINSLQFFPKSSNTARTAKTLKSLNTTYGIQAKKKEKKNIDWDEIFAICIVGGGILSVLLDWIAPWFISTMQMWLKIVLIVASGLGTYLVFYATDDNHKGKSASFAGWSGAIAILLSTVLTIYGLCGGFSPDIDDKGENVQIVKDSNNLLEKELENITSKKDYENELSEEKLSSHEDNDKCYEKKDSLNKNNPLVQTHNTMTISDSVKGGKRKTEQPFKSADAASSDVHKLKEKRDMINNNLNNQTKNTLQNSQTKKSGTYKSSKNSGQYDDVEWADN